MAVIKINGTDFSPSEMSVTVSSISGPDAGRDLTGRMYAYKIGEKYKISLSWWNPTPAQTATILTAVKNEYFWVQFTDPVTNALVTKEFYVGDRTAPIAWWQLNNKRYSKVSFNIIER